MRLSAAPVTVAPAIRRPPAAQAVQEEPAEGQHVRRDKSIVKVVIPVPRPSLQQLIATKAKIQCGEQDVRQMERFRVALVQE